MVERQAFFTGRYSCEAVEKAADSLIGVPYLHQGRNPDQGLDCFGVMRSFFERCGVVLPKYPNDYPKVWWLRRSLIEEEDGEPFFPIEMPRPGAVVLLKVNDSAVPNHLAISLASGYVLDTAPGVGAHRNKLSRLASLVHGYRFLRVWNGADH